MDMGFDGIEVRGIQSELRSEKLTPFLPDNARATLDQLKDANLTLCCLGTSCFLHDPARHEEAMREGIAALETAKRMRIPAIRVFGDKLEPQPMRETVAYFAESVKALSKHANGVSVLVEVHGAFNTIEVFEQLLDAVPDPSFGVLWDVMHSDRVYFDKFEPFYKTISRRVRHVHLKDVRRLYGGVANCLPGEGDLPLQRIAEVLASDGYDGFLSFEWERRWEPALPPPEEAFPAYMRHIKRILGTLPRV
jgi:sugar phosphate isomerase/epimerase